MGKQGDVVEVEVQLLENDLKFNNVMFYTFDINEFTKHIDVLKNNGNMNITTNNGNYLKAEINNDADQLLYTSIPLDEGWLVRVDGKIQEPTPIFDTLIGLELESGSHIIELEYIPKGLYVGGFISFASIILLLGLKKRK